MADSKISALTDGGIATAADSLPTARAGANRKVVTPLVFATAQTPDTLLITTDPLGNSVVLCEKADEAFDFAHALQTNPTLFIHSAAQSTSQWGGITHDGSNMILSAGTGIIRGTVGIYSDAAFSHGTTAGSDAGLFYTRLPFTPAGSVFATGTTSNSWRILENADTGFDFNNGRAGTSAAGDPTLIVHSRNQSTTQYMQLSSQNATGAGEIQTNLANIMIGGSKTNITEATPIAILRITSAAGSCFGATVFYTVSDSNGTDHIARSGNIVIQGVNKATAITAAILSTRDQETEDGSSPALSGGALTLTYTWTLVTGTNTCDLSITAASNAGANTLDVTYTAILTGNASTITLTPQ